MAKITRRRNIQACKRCFASKRKCGKEKPTCLRCLKAHVPCEYFTEEQIQRRIEERRVVTKDGEDVELEKSVIPDMELDPSTRQFEKKNFKLIVNNTGEYSKYFPICLFPFCDHAANVSYIVDRSPNPSDHIVTFNFATMSRQLGNIQEVRQQFPEKPLADGFVEHYFQCIHPYVPIIDKEEFFLKYRQFWARPNKYSDANSLMLMFAVCFCSAQSLQLAALDAQLYPEDHMGQFDPDVDYQKAKHVYFQCIESLKCILNSNFSPSLSSMISMVIMYYVPSLNCVSICGEVGALVRYSQLIGLHRNISHGSSTTPIRDNIYSYIWYLDSLNAYYTGLAPCMHPDYFETINNFPKYSTDLDVLFSLARFHSALVADDVLSEVNKITVTSLKPLERINRKFLEAVQIVNGLGHQILNTSGRDPEYLRWLVSECRLGLWKSALLLNVLQGFMDVTRNMSDSVKVLSKELVLYSMLLINESIIKVQLGLKTQPGSMWFIRCSYPFQAMYIVLTHIKNSPMELNFSELMPNLEYTEMEGIDYLHGDLRGKLVNEGKRAMDRIKKMWPSVMQNRYERVMKVKEHLFGVEDIETPEEARTPNKNVFPEFDYMYSLADKQVPSFYGDAGFTNLPLGDSDNWLNLFKQEIP